MTGTLVLGIGNTLLTDEGVGIHVIHHLQRHHPAPSGIAYVDGGTLSFPLADTVATAHQLIVVDAAQLHAPPGTVRTLLDKELIRYLHRTGPSVHEVGLSDLLDMAALMGQQPQQLALVGVQFHDLSWGEEPSPRVRHAIPEAAWAVLALLYRWHAMGRA